MWNKILSVFINCVEDDDDPPVDRLTQLPDSIIHHILSFLDTKSAIQTSVLSRPWKSAWKNVSVLNLRREFFQKSSTLEDFLKYILSRRCHEVNLETLSLHGVWINNNDELGSFPGFSMLASLKLYKCSIWRDATDPFRKFPCLKDLVVHDSLVFGTYNNFFEEHGTYNCYLKISGPRLLSLELRPDSGNDRSGIEIEIDAPKLESFTLDLRKAKWLPHFGETNVPSLARMNFYLHSKEFKAEDFIPVARLFQRVRCVVVNARIIRDLDRKNRIDFDDNGGVLELIASRIHGVVTGQP
ncbi:F-box/FBD/LRR-repeat protein At1g16930 [Linum grandiflorum]